MCVCVCVYVYVLFMCFIKFNPCIVEQQLAKNLVSFVKNGVLGCVIFKFKLFVIDCIT